MKTILNREECFALINVANIRSGLLVDHFVNSPDDIHKFDDRTAGIPILVPANKNLFCFEESDVFELPAQQLLETVYSLADQDYVGFKHAFTNFEFLARFEVKEAYKSYVDEIVQQNIDTMNYVASLKEKFPIIGAFQTRNIPHFGHEKIMQRMLEYCDHLVINPVLGPKKSGDVKVDCLSEVFAHLIRTKYEEKISFKPIFANMFYAGPREAIHHTIMRDKIGFQQFTIGRDHAGANDAYHPKGASALVKQLNGRLSINVIAHDGAAFCPTCNEIIIVGDCNHPSEEIKNISGTDFRASLLERRPFRFANQEMQIHLLENKIEIFEP